MPDTDAINAKLDELRAKFGFIDSVMSTIDYIKTFMDGVTGEYPPVIYMDLGAADSKYDYGGEVVALDLSWYEPYKPTVDAILSSIMWVFFCWRVYVKLPSIISGVAGSVRGIRDYDS